MQAIRKKKTSRVTAVLLALMVAVTFIPTFAFAADTGTITVYMTVSDQGQLAKAKDGSLMAWKAVTVKDTDGDGHYTYDEALAAAHEAYYEGGAAAGYDPGTGYVKKLWGVPDAGYLFFNRGQGIPNGVTTDAVANGDSLTASILSDTTYWSDWYSAFDVNTKKVTEGTPVELTLQGHLGMAYTDTDKKDVPLPAVTVKDEKGNEIGQTDDNGKVTVPVGDAGTYIVTAEGVKKDVTVSVYGIPMGKTDDDKYYIGEYVGDYDMNYFYTEEDYGDGPYPADKIKKIDMYDWMDMDEEEQETYNLVYADNYVSQTEAYYPVLVDAPLMASATIITVVKDITEAKVTVKNATYTGKALKPAVTATFDGTKLTAGSDYTVKYSNNVKAGKGKVTLTGKGSFGGSVTKTFTIAKAKQPMKVTAKGKTYKVKKLKKAKKTYKALTVSKNQGKVSYKVTYKNAKSKKALKFKNGKITVKKKTKKGTYQLTVKVTAKGTANYKAGSISKKIIVKVK